MVARLPAPGFVFTSKLGLEDHFAHGSTRSPPSCSSQSYESSAAPTANATR